MGRVLLVTGLLPYESGKTWFSLALYKALRGLGLRVSLYKPVAAFNLWYGRRALEESLKRGLLLSNDCLAYVEEAGVEAPELVNPIAIALAPLDARSYVNRGDLDGYLRDSADVLSQVVLARVTRCVERFTKHFVLPENVEKAAPGVKEVVKTLTERVAVERTTVEELRGFLLSMQAEEVLAGCLERLSEGDVTIVESFNNSLTPYGGALKAADVLVVVAPGSAFVFDITEELLEAVARGVEEVGQEALLTSFILSRLKPNVAIDLGYARSPDDLAQHLKGYAEVVVKSPHT